MTAVRTEAETRLITLPWLLRRAAVLTWFELLKVVGACLVLLASIVPFAVAASAWESGSAPWWLVAVASLPVSLLLTGLARFASVIAKGDRPLLRDAYRFDPVLALSLSVFGTVAGVLLTQPTLQLVGFVAAAVLLLLAPFALAYGAVRGRRGLTTWRGAFILVAYRPSWALTVLALSLIGGFVVAATVGALGLIVPCILSVFTAGVVTELLRSIDERGDR